MMGPAIFGQTGPNSAADPAEAEALGMAVLVIDPLIPVTSLLAAAHGGPWTHGPAAVVSMQGRARIMRKMRAQSALIVWLLPFELFVPSQYFYASPLLPARTDEPCFPIFFCCKLNCYECVIGLK